MKLQDVVDGALCSGCGACAYLQPDEIRMVDVPQEGLRPRPIDSSQSQLPDGDGALVCPGAGLGHDPADKPDELIASLYPGWGPVYALWEGFASDREIRYAGSSGGAASALGLYALEREGFGGVLHVESRDDVPYLNQTVVSRTRDELLSRTGSRYAPASPCDGLHHVENAAEPFLFIGKPCDVAATRAARKLRPRLDLNLGITVAFFCAGTPSTAGTLEMLRRMGVPDPNALMSLRYRGNGWPGRATAVFSNGGGRRATAELSYEESWGAVLSKHVQWRCRICADHTGEFADIAVGDPWYREIRDGEAGSSLILARTEKGRLLVERAIAAGYLEAQPASPELLPSSQPNLLRARGAVWGRVLSLRMIGATAPRYRGFETFRFWRRELTASEKFRSIFGTIRRCIARGFHPWFRRTFRSTW